VIDAIIKTLLSIGGRGLRELKGQRRYDFLRFDFILDENYRLLLSELQNLTY
jgi:hypothetical protein